MLLASSRKPLHLSRASHRYRLIGWNILVVIEQPIFGVQLWNFEELFQLGQEVLLELQA